MIFCDITWIGVWKWLNESQLLSTLLILVFGTFLIDWWHSRKESDREAVSWLLQFAEEYTGMANEYWSNHPSKTSRQLVLVARLKSEYSVLYNAVENIKGMSDEKRKKVRESINDLYDAATGAEFETAQESTQESLIRTLTGIAKSSATLRRRLRAYDY